MHPLQLGEMDKTPNGSTPTRLKTSETKTASRSFFSKQWLNEVGLSLSSQPWIWKLCVTLNLFHISVPKRKKNKTKTHRHTHKNKTKKHTHKKQTTTTQNTGNFLMFLTPCWKLRCCLSRATPTIPSLARGCLELVLTWKHNFPQTIATWNGLRAGDVTVYHS